MTDVCADNAVGSIAIRGERAGGAPVRLSLQLSAESCWSGLLGPWPLPSAGAIDAMDAVLGGEQGGFERITLVGCPSACLLPMLWIRTIWCAGDKTELVIEWDRVADHGGVRGRQASGVLACAMADWVECADPGRAETVWGVDLADPGSSEDAFDLLTNIVDCWDTDLHRTVLASDWNESVRRALANCALLGHRRVGVYGAGTHTRASGDALMEPGVEIVCVIDDDARRHGDRMWGYEIVSRERAIGLGLDAVVISANSIEDRLWERAGVFRDAGVPVMRLYG